MTGRDDDVRAAEEDRDDERRERGERHGPLPPPRRIEPPVDQTVMDADEWREFRFRMRRRRYGGP
jgi:hypothetical protein